MGHGKTFTADDRKFLKSLRITPADVCPTCKGEKCTDCRQTGLVQPGRPEPADDQC